MTLLTILMNLMYGEGFTISMAGNLSNLIVEFVTEWTMKAMFCLIIRDLEVWYY